MNGRLMPLMSFSYDRRLSSVDEAVPTISLRRAFAGVVLFFCALGGGVHMAAGSCAEPPPPLVALVQADAVFTGRAVRVEDSSAQPTCSKAYKWVFLEVVAWKGGCGALPCTAFTGASWASPQRVPAVLCLRSPAGRR
jgi:hypothetical protein